MAILKKKMSNQNYQKIKRELGDMSTSGKKENRGPYLEKQVKDITIWDNQD